MSSIQKALAMLGGVAQKFCCEAVTIEDLMTRQTVLSEKAQVVQAAADAEGRPLTEDEAAQIKACCDEFDALQVDIDRRERMQAQAAHLQGSVGRIVAPEAPAAQEDAGAGAILASGMQPHKVQQKPVVKEYKSIVDAGPSQYGQHGFHHMGEFALAVQKASVRGGGRIDPRLLLDAPSATSSEGTPADGGYAVPPDFRNEIWRKVLGEASLLSFCDQQTSSSNSLTFPTDQTTPWQATGGVRVNWTAEGSKITESKVALGETTIKLQKLAALLPVTEEILEDAPAVSRYISSRVPEVLGYTLNKAIISGTGDTYGQPLGVLNSDALVTVDAEADQAADTVTFKNICAMWSRLHARGQNRAIWVCNPIVSEQLMSMAFPGTGTAVPVYLPPNGLEERPYSRLMGRPVIASEACSALGDVGDIMLLDLTQYMAVTKTVGMRADVSMHLYFDYDIMTYRFIMRIGGKPWWTAPITGSDGTTTYSAFVALAERAGGGGETTTTSEATTTE